MCVTTMRLAIASLVAVGCGRIDFAPLGDASGASGDGPAAGFRRQVSITNVAATPLPAGFAVGVPLDAIQGTTVRPDLADVRLFRIGAAEHDRVIDRTASGAPATLWFALAADIGVGASDDQYLVAYGDPAATSAPADGTRVFAFYDDFTAPTLGAHWQAQGTPQLSAGELTLVAASNGDGLVSNPATDGVPLIASFEIRVRATDPTSAPGAYYYWFGYQTGFAPVTPFTNWNPRSPSSISGEHASSMPPCNGSPYCRGPELAQSNAYRVFRIDRLADRQVFRADRVIHHTVAQPTVLDQALNVRNFAMTSELVVDWMRARAIVDPEPVVTLGDEQPR